MCKNKDGWVLAGETRCEEAVEVAVESGTRLFDVVSESVPHSEARRADITRTCCCKR